MQVHALGDLYQQQRDELLSLRISSQREMEWRAKIASLMEEKEAGHLEGLRLRQQLELCQSQLRELEVRGRQWKAELERVCEEREEEKGRAWIREKVRKKVCHVCGHVGILLFLIRVIIIRVYNDHNPIESHNVTNSDLVMDMLGAIPYYLIFR